VLIDGHDIREYTLESLRAQISVVLQESVLLRASVAENIAYGRPSASAHEVEAAARAASAHEFIAALPDGYDTEIGERGETLSGGQRQRIAIARAILRDAPIVLLDEPLTGLDAASAAAVLEALERLMSGKTVLVISHQPAISQRAEEIVVLEDGRVVPRVAAAELADEQGRHRQLVRAARLNRARDGFFADELGQRP
jgi:ATP-binding cassette subfamily B protein